MWSYSGNPGTSPRDELRFLLGDTQEADPLLQDGELDYILTEAEGSVTRAAVTACESIIAKLAREADFSSGATSLSASQRREGYERLLGALKRKAARLPRILASQTIPARFQRSDDKYRRP